MFNQSQLTPVGKILHDSLQNIARYDVIDHSRRAEPTVHIQNVGSEISIAYEQLRNASENIADHLLFQRAILRFIKREVDLESRTKQADAGLELITELTQAGYLENDTVRKSIINDLDTLITEHRQIFQKVIRSNSNLHLEATKWIYELLSVRAEQLFNHPIRDLSFAYLAHSHFLPIINVDEYKTNNETIVDDQQKILYIAVHRALLKSDNANIRTALHGVYHVSHNDIKNFIAFNKSFDRLAQLKTTAAISRLVSINGAPLRAIYTTFFDDNTNVKSIEQKNLTLRLVESQLDRDYGQTKINLRRGIMKSIIFLFMTKVLIGLFIEVPYDWIVYREILILPLVLNLLAPPVLLALNTLTVRLPSTANRRAVVEYVDSMLYGDGQQKKLRKKKIDTTGAFTTIYMFIAFILIGLLSFGLYKLDFNIVQGAIFFVFFSTALFLGYRLSLQVRELELVRGDQGILTLMRDFVYTPFIYIGHHISYRFSKLNIVSHILDTLVELPLKTFLRLVRQWINFLNNRKDDLL